jgi:hypothetical protein
MMTRLSQSDSCLSIPRMPVRRRSIGEYDDILEVEESSVHEDHHHDHQHHTEAAAIGRRQDEQW